MLKQTHSKNEIRPALADKRLLQEKLELSLKGLQVMRG
jgi:hypothetical protein